MINKKIASELAVGIVLLLAIAIGVIFWLQAKKDEQSARPGSSVIDNQEIAKTDTKSSVSNIQEKAVDDTEDWQTYRNEKYGFEFKYPVEWNVASNSQDDTEIGEPLILIFGPNATLKEGSGGMEFNGVLATGQALQDFVKKSNENVEVGATSEKSVIINELNAIISILPHAGTPKFETKSVSFERVRDKNVFSLFVGYHPEFQNYPQDRVLLEKFDKVISTFKFTDAVDISNEDKIDIIRGLLTSEQSKASPEITIMQSGDNFIKANLFFNPGGYYILVAKVDGRWVKVLNGNGIPKCEDIVQYDLPEDIIGCTE